MISVDTNILLYGLNRSCPEFEAAHSFLQQLAERRDVVIGELVLVELYMLLRNPSVLSKPLAPEEAVSVCGRFRSHPHWAIAESAAVMGEAWRYAAEPSFPRRRIIDARLALTLKHHGVTEFATRNLHDFSDFGFERIWNPLDPHG